MKTREEVNEMKNVLLIGDSIRFGAPPKSPGYGVYVKKMLEGRANVYAPNENCRFAQYTLRNLYDWERKLRADNVKIDLVHWNNGLWDVLHVNGDDALTPCDVYVEFLRRIYNKLKKLFPEAKIVFALSTGVIEEMGSPDFMRYNSEIEQYNAAARALMDTLGVPVNDLYSISREIEDTHCDWVHFGEEGSKVLAEAVVEKIIPELD